MNMLMPSGRVTLVRVNSYLEGVLGKLAGEVPPAGVEEIHRSLVATTGRIEGGITRKRLRPEQLTAAAREARGWIAFFARRENLLDYLAARTRAGEVLEPVVGRKYPLPLGIQFRPMRGIYRLRRTDRGSILSLPTPMIVFDRAGFESLARRIVRSDRTARQHIHDLMLGESYQNVLAELETLAGVVQRSRGTHHDLRAAFDRVNAAYFQSQMPRPTLVWSTQLTGWKFGHYDFVHDTVMISRTLDDPAVEEFLLDYVLYHELLHKKHGVRWSNGRQYAHTGEFARDEKRYARHREAENALTRLASDTRNRHGR